MKRILHNFCRSFFWLLYIYCLAQMQSPVISSISGPRQRVYVRRRLRVRKSRRILMIKMNICFNSNISLCCSSSSASVRVYEGTKQVMDAYLEKLHIAQQNSFRLCFVVQVLLDVPCYALRSTSTNINYLNSS